MRQDILLHQAKVNASSLWRYNGFSATVLDSIGTGFVTLAGIDSDEDGDTLSVDLFGGDILKYDKFENTVLDSFNFTAQPVGVDWYDVDSNMYVGKRTTNRLYKLSGFSATVLDSFVHPGGPLGGNAWNLDSEFIVNDTAFKSRRFDGFSTTLVDSITYAGTWDPWGCVWDEVGDNFVWMLQAAIFGGLRFVIKNDGFSATILDTWTPGHGLNWTGCGYTAIPLFVDLELGGAEHNSIFWNLVVDIEAVILLGVLQMFATLGGTEDIFPQLAGDPETLVQLAGIIDQWVTLTGDVDELTTLGGEINVREDD